MIRIIFYTFLSIRLCQCRNITPGNLSESQFGTCVTGKGKIGSCIYLKECTFVYNIIRTTTLTKKDRFFFKQNQCGYKENKVLICCPKDLRKLPSISNRYLPEPGQCGVTTSSRIYGGNATKIDEFPWMALLEYNRGNASTNFLCGGSLISNRYVLTAAHCVTGGPIDQGWFLKRVRLGEWNLDTDIDCVVSATGEKDCAPKPLDVEIEMSIPHPLYKMNSRNQHHDIALIRLSQNVVFSDFIKPICLPLAGNLRQANLDGVRMTIAGWGKTETTVFSKIKMKAFVRGFNMNKCRQLYGRIMIDQTQICAGGDNRVDSCKGDSGGPLIITVVNNRTGPYYTLGGIISFGPWPCGLQDWPGVYTRVGEYIEWIITTIQKHEVSTYSNSTNNLPRKV